MRCTWLAFSTPLVQVYPCTITSQSQSESGQMPHLTALDVFSLAEKSQALLKEIVDVRLNVSQDIALIADKANYVLGNIRSIVARWLRKSNFLSGQCWWGQTWLIVASFGDPLSHFKRDMEKEERYQQMVMKKVRPRFQAHKQAWIELGWLIQVKRNLKEDLIVAAATWSQLQRGWSPNSQWSYAI